MNKKLLMIAGILGIVGFVAAFALSFFFGQKTKPLQQMQTVQQQMNSQDQSEDADLDKPVIKKEENALSTKLKEHQLQGLIHDVREKVREYEKKMGDLNENEKRLTVAQKSLQKDIESLSKLRVELASLTADLKQQRKILLDTRIKIQRSEQENFQRIAATYDTMEVDGAAKIFTNMSKLNTSESKGLDDVVKILYYMEDRNKAGVLAQLVNTEPKLAALLSQELKKIKEVAQ